MSVFIFTDSYGVDELIVMLVYTITTIVAQPGSPLHYKNSCRSFLFAL